MVAPPVLHSESSSDEPESSRSVGNGPDETLFVGRSAELESLVASLPGNRADFSTVRLIAGRPGIGKSRLAAELAREASAHGVRVGWGRCWDPESSPAYWPWTQVVRSLTEVDRQTSLSGMLLEDPSSASRFDLFDATAEVIRQASATAPLLVILEDLHLADSESLLLARFIASQLPGSALLIIGTYREADAAGRPEIAGHLAELNRLGPRVNLHPLSVDAVESLVEDPARAAKVHAATGGNPLFIEQVLSTYGSTDGELTAAPRVLIEVTIDRLTRLPDETASILRRLVILEAGSTIDDLAELSEQSPEQCRHALAPAIEAGFVRESGGSGEARFSFSHHIMADAVRQTADPAELEQLHGRRADALTGNDQRRGERAHHLLLAGPAMVDTAVRVSREHAAECRVLLAFDDAVRFLSRAISALDSADRDDAATRIRLLTDLARVQQLAEDHEAAAAAIERAWRLSLDTADAEGLGASALGVEFRFDFSGGAAKLRAERCRIALDHLGSTPSPLRVRLLATLATAQLVADPPVARTTARTAIAEAAEVDCPVATAYALIADSVTDLSPDSLDHRLAAARRILAIAGSSDERELAPCGYFLLLAALLESGDTRALDAELAPHSTISDQFAGLSHGRQARWLRCTRAILDGEAALAEQLANEAYAVAERSGDPDAGSVWAGQIAVVRWLQGRAGEIESIFLQARQLSPDGAIWAAALSWVWLLQGRREAAHGLMNSLGDFDSIPRDRNWLATIAIVAEVAGELGTESQAWQLRDALLPYSEQLVPIGLGVACWGTVARPLGLLAKRLGNNDEAIAHFRTAIEVCSRVGAQAWLAEAQLELAGMLLLSDDGRAEASDLVADALATSTRLGLTALVDHATPMRTNLSAEHQRGTAVRPLTASPVSEGRPRVSVLGVFEVVGANGTISRWTSRKARELLKVLVARHGAAITREALMDLLWPGEAPHLLANRFAVAVSTVRRALDPDRQHPASHYLKSEGDVLALKVHRISIDSEEFLARARTADSVANEDERFLLRQEAIAGYRGEALADEPYAAWAEPFRAELQTVFCAAARDLARLAGARGEHLQAVTAYRRILHIDPYDQQAHEGLIAALRTLGAHGQAAAAEVRLRERLGELGMSNAI